MTVDKMNSLRLIHCYYEVICNVVGVIGNDMSLFKRVVNESGKQASKTGVLHAAKFRPRIVPKDEALRGKKFTLAPQEIVALPHIPLYEARRTTRVGAYGNFENVYVFCMD